MSATITPPKPIELAPPPPSTVTQPPQQQEALVSTSPANQATAAASGGGAAAAVVVLIWLLGLFKITMPPDVAAALVFSIGAGIHWVMITFGKPSPT